MAKKLALIFITAFLLNAVWEHSHHVLYVHYQGEAITSLILFRAALFDALIISILGVLFLSVRFFRERLWLIALGAIFFAVGLEWFALATDRWAYTDAMPLVPVIQTGLTPTIQLGFLAYMSIYFVEFLIKKK